MRTFYYDRLSLKASSLYPLWHIGIRRELNKVKYMVFNGKSEELYIGTFREVNAFLEGISYAKYNLIARNRLVQKKAHNTEQKVLDDSITF